MRIKDVQSIKTTRAFDVTGKEQGIIKVSKNKGERLFASLGFEQQLNKNFWKRGDTFVNYNVVDKTWHINGSISEIKGEAK